MSPTVPALPADLYGEIVVYLWDDIPSLKSCSLANPIMTLAGQKLLFRSITLGPERNLLREDPDDDTSGTSCDLWRLLARSPHIAGYIKSIHITDIKTQYAGFGGDDDLVHDVGESDEGKEINLATGIWTLPI